MNAPYEPVTPPQPEAPPRPIGRHPQRRQVEPVRAGPFVPLLLAVLALTGWFALQTWLLVEERAALTSALAGQQPTVDNSAKLRQSLDAIAADTQRLAEAGNPNARLLVEELRRRGVTIKASAETRPQQ